jgi:hypothetical protein
MNQKHRTTLELDETLFTRLTRANHELASAALVLKTMRTASPSAAEVAQADERVDALRHELESLLGIVAAGAAAHAFGDVESSTSERNARGSRSNRLLMNGPAPAAMEPHASGAGSLGGVPPSSEGWP